MLADANVAERAGRVTDRIAGRVAVLVFHLGERRKTLRTLERVLDGLAEVRTDRETAVVGVGGGVASDLFGFAAATYMRGVPYAHVSTTLLAMVDASIGGKTGVDLAAGKNLAGVFRQPILSYADVGALATLPYRHLREGLAEVVKAGIIEGGDFFDALETLAPHAFWRWPWETIVADAIEVKRMIVADDPLERGDRELLNLGHTFGHAIERASNYRVSHGAGVSIGLRAAGLLALRTGRFTQDEHLRVLALLTLLRLPMTTRVDSDLVLRAMLSDKKARNGALRFVLPRAIGDVEYGVRVSERDIRAVLARIAQPPGAGEFR